jgi:hypothetical protein
MSSIPFVSKAKMTFRPKAEKRSRNLDADLRTGQVYLLEGRTVEETMKSARLNNRRYEMIGGKKFLVVS